MKIGHYHHDAEGNVIALSDEQQNIVQTRVDDASGKELTSSSETPSPFLWNGASGYYFDNDVEMHLMGLRWYDKGFFTRDPIGLAGGKNLYGYVGNNSVNQTDSLGTESDAQRAQRLASFERIKRDIACDKRVGWATAWIKAPFQITWGELWSESNKGAAAELDAMNPIASPYRDKYQLYDPSDPWMQGSRACGHLAQNAILFALTPNLATWARNPILYEAGQAALPAHIWRGLQNMDPITRGIFLLEHYGWLRVGWMGLSNSSAIFSTGPTPGFTVLLQGIYNYFANEEKNR